MLASRPPDQPDPLEPLVILNFFLKIKKFDFFSPIILWQVVPCFEAFDLNNSISRAKITYLAYKALIW